MPRFAWGTAACLVTLLVGGGQPLQAGDPGQFMGYHAYPAAVEGGAGYGTELVEGAYGAGWGHGGGSPQLDAPLYAAPHPNVPIEMGGTLITNPAFAPHEFLYAHKYRALYPQGYKVYWRYAPRVGCKQTSLGITVPFVYWTKVAYKVVPKGTQVTVKYHSEYKLGSMFLAPRTWTR